MLQGIRVIEMANVISGPFAGMLLADMGAEVVKVEMPGSGDPFRGWAGSDAAIAASFAAYNRGKKSLALDTRTEAAREIYLRLVDSADVVIDNFRPGVLDRSGIGPQALCARCPGLVYCDMTGLGSRGPDAGRPAYDAIAQGMSGLWSQLTDLSRPEAVGPPISDQLAGLYAAYAVLGALVARGRNGGRGQRIEVSMLAASLAFQPHAAAEYLTSGSIATRVSRAHVSQSYAFVASDGLPLAIHLSSQQKFFRALATAVGRPDLETDPRFAEKRARHGNYDVLQAELQREIGRRPRAVWLTRLAEADVPCTAIHTIDAALSEPQVKAISMVRAFGRGDRAMRLIGRGFATTEPLPDPADGAVPYLGEHTGEVLRGLGLDEAALERLGTAGAISAPEGQRPPRTGAN